MIGISTPTYDINGSFLIRHIESDTDTTARSRRVTRTATLDGASEIEDLGMSHSDRTFDIRARGLSLAEYDKLALLVETYPLLIITTDEGAFEGAPEKISINNDITNIRILINSKLS